MNRTGYAGGGFTIVEALMALSLLAIISGMAYSFYLFVHKQVLVRERKSFEFDAAMQLIESAGRNIRSSRGTLMLDESQWVFITPRGDTASYVFTDTALLYNEVVVTLGGRPIPRFSFSCSGSDSTLDVDGDGEVSFREIDRDGNGRIEGYETQSISWITATLVLQTDPEKSVATVETVKNRLHHAEGVLETYFWK